MSNPAHSGLLKIGQTSKDPLVRRKDLSSTGVPEEFVIEYQALCISPIHGLSTHMTYGVMTPFVDWELICQQNIDMMKKEGIWE